MLVTSVAAWAQGTLRGTVKEAATGEPIIMANVVVKQDGQMVGGATTDFDGMYTIKGLPVGKYDMEVSYIGYQPIHKKGVEVKASDFTIQNFSMQMGADVLEEVQIIEEKNPVIEIGSATSGSRVSADDIARMPGTSVESIVAQVGGVGYNDGGAGTARGESGMVTQVGGVRVRTGVDVPKEAIGEIQVILGGTPASIGEAIGGTQIITLKPPTNKFTGVIRWDSWLDYRLDNTLSAYLTGPVYVKHIPLEGGGTMDRTILGFRFTTKASYTNFGAYRPAEKRYKMVKDEVVQQLEQAPLVYDPVLRSVNYAGEYLSGDDFVAITRPTVKNYYADESRYADFSNYYAAAQLALVFRFSDYSTLELTGDFAYSKSPNMTLDPFNLTRNANNVTEANQYTIRAEYQQRFPDAAPAAEDATLPQAKRANISNVMFAVNAMYGRTASKTYNEMFGENLFQYGHVGTFVTEMTPNYTEGFITLDGIDRYARIQDSWRETLISYTPSEYNPILSNYNNQLYAIPDIAPSLLNGTYLRSFRGLLNGDVPESIYGLFNNVGIQNVSYSKGANYYYYVAAKVSAIVGKHELEVGYQFDCTSSTSFGINTRSLWTIMRNNANAHISQLDFNNPIMRSDGNMIYVDYNRLYTEGAQSHFDIAMREALGLDVRNTDWIDVDRYSPDFYQNNGGLEMFSANELFNSGSSIVSYAGYDHTGKKYDSRGWSLDDFFDPVSKGHKNYQYLPAFSPIYMGLYAQDKFAFEDLIFNIGLRVDYFDANQMVLKDPYLLYESYTVGDLRNASDLSFNTGLGDGNFASNAENDWVVYVNDNNASTPTITGYRKGSVWYNAEGIEVSSPNEISGEAGRPTPFLTRGEGGGREVSTTGNASGNLVSSRAFEDYKPQIIPMPRIAFSFPVGEKSQFKANYDIIARRPSDAWSANYLTYLYMTQMTSASNPNLKPERVTNYEVSFQQALNDHIGISISTYYKETRDLIQLVQYAGADPNPNYYSYDNLDFKTTKGFTFNFDMRQTKNLRVSANYTLQYAEGTGLPSTTMMELIKEGYTTLKMLNPISDDRRHEFKANVDFRFGPKEGPVIKRAVTDKATGEKRVKEIRPLQNFGVNFTAVAQSGRPYTQQFSFNQPTIVGSYMGARLPWGFYVDAIVNKTFPIMIKDGEGNIKRQTALDVSFTINNLFNIRNITSVFPVTGDPNDDGYLSDPETQNTINAYMDPQAFREMYSITLNNSYWRYGNPRFIKLSVAYQF